MLTLTTGKEDVLLKLNNRSIEEFDSRLSLSLEPGEYRMELIKEGYNTFSRDISLAPGGTTALEITLEKKVWKSRTIYQDRDPESTDNNKIIGCAVSEEFAVAVSPSTPTSEPGPGTAAVRLTATNSSGLPYIDKLEISY